MPDTLEEKAARILAEGRLTIKHLGPLGTGDPSKSWIIASCKGTTGEYLLGWDAITVGYRCTCPELKGGCSHILALKLVVEDWQEVETPDFLGKSLGSIPA